MKLERSPSTTFQPIKQFNPKIDFFGEQERLVKIADLVLETLGGV